MEKPYHVVEKDDTPGAGRLTDEERASTDADGESIERFIAAYNTQAVPFEWRKQLVHSSGLKKYYGELRH